jgi:hypothetical protein
MRQTEIVAHDFNVMLGTKLTKAAIRFVAAVGAVIGISLLLASL